jgi:hypothetical protein
MHRSAIVLIMVLTCAPLLAFDIPGLPKIPGPGDIEVPIKIPGLDKILGQEPGLSTSFDDALTGIPFLDDFNLPWRAAMTEMPRGIGHSFMLAPGGYQAVLESYCMNAGTHGPGRGEGYLYAPLKGPLADEISDILNNSVVHPEIDQHDIQVLIWGVLARTKISDMSKELQQVARTLLTADQIKRLNGGALGMIPEELREQAFGKLPPLVRQVLDAENTIRRMLAEKISDLDQIEGIAILSGEPESTEGDEEVPLGRWSYMPGGFIVRYFPRGYSRTTVQVFVPGDATVQQDDLGRITAIYDSRGNRIETAYDDAEPAAVPGDDAVKGYAFRSIRVVAPDPRDPSKSRDVTLEGVGWALVGMPTGKGRPEGGAGRFAGLAERYRWADTHRQDTAKLLGLVRKGAKAPVSDADVQTLLAQMVNLASYGEALKQALAAESRPWSLRRVGLVKQAWAERLAAAEGAGLTQVGAAGASGGRVQLASTALSPGLLGVGQAALLRGRGGGMRSFGPGGSATPANRARQRLGQSPRGDEDQNDPDAPDSDEDRDREEEGQPRRDRSDKEVLDKAQNVLDWFGTGKDVVDLATGSPKDFLAGKIGMGIPDYLFGQILSWNLNKAREIGKALGGDPPRDDYDIVATPQVATVPHLTPGPDCPAPRAEALNALMDATCALVAYLQAGQLSQDRLGGAIQANNEKAASQQGAAYVYYKRLAGQQMLVVADCLQAVIDELYAEGVTELPIPADAIRAYQDRLRAEGFTDAERQAAAAAGFSDAELENIRQQRLSADPELAAGDIIQDSIATVTALREWGQCWASLPDVAAYMPEAGS